MSLSKSEKLVEILKALKYPSSKLQKSHAYTYFFGIPEVNKFFEWFIRNISEECMLSKLEIEQFKLKASKNRIIWDVDKLHALSSINLAHKSSENFDLFDKNDTDDEEELLKQIDELQEETDELEERLESSKNIKKISLDEHKKSNKNQTRKIINYLDANLSQQNNHLDVLRKKFNQTLSNVHSKINLFEPNCMINYNTLLDDYSSHEKEYLDLVKRLVKQYFDNSEASKCLDEDDLLYFQDYNTQDKQYYEKYFKLIEYKYPKLLFQWISDKIKLEDAECLLREIEKIDFEFIATILKSNSIESELLALNKNTKQLRNEMIQVDKKLVKNIHKLTSAKTLNLIENDLIFKEIRLRNCIIKQERIKEFLIVHKSRLSFLNQIQELKLNDIEMLKQTLEHVRKGLRSMSNNSSLMTSTTTSHSVSSFNSMINSKNLAKSLKINPLDAFTRMINQSIITLFSSTEQLSIKLADNVNILCKTNAKINEDVVTSEYNLKKNLKEKLENINSALKYLYGSQNDLSKIELHSRCIIEPSEKLKKEQDEVNILFQEMILSEYNEWKEYTSKNKLAKLKHNLFVDFYLNPKNIETHFLKYHLC